MKKLGILMLPMILAMSVFSCSKTGGTASKGGSSFKGEEDLTVENIRNVEFKEEKTLTTNYYSAISEAAGKFADEYHSLSYFQGSVYSAGTGSYESATRYGYSTTIEMGKNYFALTSYNTYSIGGLTERYLNSAWFNAYRKGVEYCYSSSSSYGRQYWTYTDVAQEEFDEEFLNMSAYFKSMIYYDYTAGLVTEMFQRASYGEGLIKFGVLANGNYALVLTTPDTPYYSFTYTYNGETRVAHSYNLVDMILTFKMSNGKARFVSGYKEQGYYYDFISLDGNYIPMPEGELYFYDGEYFGFTGNSTKDLGASHFISLVPQKQHYVTLDLVTYQLSEDKLVNPTHNTYAPNDQGDGNYMFELSIPIGTPFKLMYYIEERVLKNGEYVDPVDPYIGEITKLELALGLKIERLEDADGETYFFVTPNSGTITIDYEFSINTKKAEAVTLSNPIPVPYIY